MSRVKSLGLALMTVWLAACSTVPGGTGRSDEAPAVTAPAASPSHNSPGSGLRILEGSGQGLQMLAEAPVRSTPTVASVETPRDLWDRMRRGFTMPDLDNALVRNREQWYSQRPEYLQRMGERGSKYLFHIVEELEKRNLPQELALLPFIESAFNPQAVSHAKAAGMWQFMPATGRDFDLKQNAFRDDRRDVLASTKAALDYLERLYKMFGDWHLALAAYNWGEGNVSRAIQRNKAAGLGTGYEDLRMPEETRQYVPKLQAMNNLVAQPDAFGVRLPAVGNHPFFDSVRIERDMDVALIARLADVSEKDFRTLNPSHNKPMIMAAGTPTILLPWDNAVLFEERLKNHPGPLASWTVWRVPSDMSVSAAAKQLGMSESELRELNRIPPRMQLRRGSTLLVERSDRHHADVPEHIADGGQILLSPERPAVRTVRVKARAGDSLASLAQRHKVSVKDLADWNQLKPGAPVKAGQVLVVRVAQAAAPRTATAARPTAKPRSASSAAKAKPARNAKTKVAATAANPKR